MRNRILFIVIAAVLALSGCKQNNGENTSASFDLDNNDKIEYVVDYTVCFTSDHDSTMQVTATSNYGDVDVVQIESENLIGADSKLVKNTFIILEDSVPMGRSITLQRGDLSYTGGKPEFIHNQVVGSDDLVELRIFGTDTLTHSRPTLYSIRDNMFYDPYDEESFTIAGGQRFTIVLPVVTEEMYPEEKESHTIQIGFGIH